MRFSLYRGSEPPESKIRLVNVSKPLQESRDIKITQFKDEVSHSYLNYFLHVAFIIL